MNDDFRVLEVTANLATEMAFSIVHQAMPTFYEKHQFRFSALVLPLIRVGAAPVSHQDPKLGHGGSIFRILDVNGGTQPRAKIESREDVAATVSLSCYIRTMRFLDLKSV